MNSVADTAMGSAVIAPKEWSQASQLFPTLFGQPYMGRKITVLDIGAARQRTVAFFSQFKCRLHIVDLYSADLLKQPVTEMSPTELQLAFKQLLGLNRQSAIDICLFWDIFNYLDPAQIKALCMVLKPHLHRGTRAHGFGSRNSEIMLADLEYSIQDADSFGVTQRRLNRLPCHPLPQAKLIQHMSIFSIDRGTLLADGRQEMLLKSSL